MTGAIIMGKISVVVTELYDTGGDVHVELIGPDGTTIAYGTPDSPVRVETRGLDGDDGRRARVDGQARR